MPRYRLTLEYDDADDAAAGATMRRALGAAAVGECGIELSREVVRPWRRVVVVARRAAPSRRPAKVAR